MMQAILENRFLSRWAELLPRRPGQLGTIHESDAELVPLEDGRLLAFTIDALSEEIQLGLYRTPETAGRIAAVSALSDLAAVGAEPIGLLLSVTLPEDGAELAQERVARGVAEVCDAARTYVLGGDTNRGEVLAVTCAAMGLVAGAPLLRVGARAGESVLASGPLGAGAVLAASRLLDLKISGVEENYRPRPRLREGRALRGIATACIDTSDGLIAALDQVCRLNRLAIRIETPLEQLLDPAARQLGRSLGVGAFPFLASQHGEYELVFTVPVERLKDLQAAAAALGWQPLTIGFTAAGEGLFVGDRAIDAARVRNLADEQRHDLGAYIKALCGMQP